MLDVDQIESKLSLLNYAPAGVCVLREDFTVAYWNDRMVAWTGVPKDRIVGTDIRERYRRFANPVYCEALESVFGGGPPVVFSARVHEYLIPVGPPEKQKRLHHTSVVGIPEGESGRCHALLVIEDVTDLSGRSGQMRDAQRTDELAKTNEELQEQIRERTRIERELQDAQRQTELLLASMSSIVIWVDEGDRIIRWNASAARTFGIEPNRALGLDFAECEIDWDWVRVARGIEQCKSEAARVRLDDVYFIRQDNSPGMLGLTISPMTDESARSRGFLILGADVTERRSIENQLDQRQKLEAMSRLAGGIAGEIAAPLEAAERRIRTLKERSERLEKGIDAFMGALDRAREEGSAEGSPNEAPAKPEGADVKHLCGEIAEAADESLAGMELTERMVRDMRRFAHIQSETDELVDVNMAIENIATLCRNEWKRVAELRTHYDPSVPRVRCAPEDLDQVILNLLVNAADAIERVIPAGSSQRGLITISTRSKGEGVEIDISDSGCGIKEEVKDKIFDLFFTTKPEGTGHGLAMSRALIVDKLGGTIDFQTEVGKGTTFRVCFPARRDTENREP